MTLRSTPTRRSAGCLQPRAVALACLCILSGAGPARAEPTVFGDGDIQPWFGRAASVALPGATLQVGRLVESGSNWGSVGVRDGGRLSASGLRVVAGNLNIADPGSFVALSGTGSGLWVAQGSNGIVDVSNGGAIVFSACNLGDCSIVVGGTTGRPMEYLPGSAVPVSIENRAKGDLIIRGAGSRVVSAGVLRVAQASVIAPGQPGGFSQPGGTAAGVLRVDQGGALTTGQALLGIGASGAAANGLETAAGYVVIDGPGSRWTLQRNAASGEQARLVLGAAGTRSSGPVAGTLAVTNGALVTIDGRGGALAHLVAGDGGPGSAGYVDVVGSGSRLEFRGDSGYIHLGGSGTRGGGRGGLSVLGGGQVLSLEENGLVFATVGRNGSGARGDLLVEGVAADGRRSEFALGGRGGAGSGAEGQSAFLNIGRGGATGSVMVNHGGLLRITTEGGAAGVATTTGAGFSVGRDAGSRGELRVANGGVLTVASADRRPFAAVGQDGSGFLHIWGGGQVDLIATDAFASGPVSQLHVGSGGSGASSAQGLLVIQGAGSALVMGPQDDNLLIAGGAAAGSAAALGEITVNARGRLETTAAYLGNGAQGTGRLHIDDASVLLRGEMTQSTSTGAAMVVGRGGGSGRLSLDNQGLLRIDSAGSFAGLAVGGSGAAPTGTGEVDVRGNARIEVADRGRLDHSLWIGRAGTGSMVLEGGSALVEGAGRVIVGAASGADGRVFVNPGSALLAGRLLLLGGNESPAAGGSGLVHANGWQPLALNQAAGAGGRAELHAQHSRVIATHMGLGIAAGSHAAASINPGATLELADSLMVGALGDGTLRLRGGGAWLSAATAQAVVGGFAGGRGELSVDAGSRLRIDGASAVLDIGRGAGSSGLVSVIDGQLSLTSTQSRIGVGVAGTGVLQVLGSTAQLRAGSLLAAAEPGGKGTLWVQGGGQLQLLGSTQRIGTGGLGLGLAEGARGVATVDGAGSLLRVHANDSVVLAAGDSGGSGRVSVTGGAMLELRALARSTQVVAAVGGQADSLLLVDASSQASLAGIGNFVAVTAGAARLHGQLDLVLTAQPIGIPSLGSEPGGSITLPFGAAVQVADRRQVSLSFDGYTPVRGDYVPLFSAQTIQIDPRAAVGSYSPVQVAGRDGWAFGLGKDQVAFRIQSPGAGLYPVLERSIEQGQDVWGVRFIDQAVYVDWDRASNAKLRWLRDADSGEFRAWFDNSASATLSHASLSDANRDAVLGALATQLRGDTLATAGRSSRLGNALALPVIDSRVLDSAPTNALVVRFASTSQAPDCAAAGCSHSFTWGGYAFDTEPAGSRLPLDFGNQRKDGEVVVMADDASIARRSAAAVASVVLHEVGHGLGLLHTDGAAGSNPMLPNSATGYFSDQPVAHVERSGDQLATQVLTQNAMYHLLAYTYGWSAQRLAGFGGVAGTADIDPASWAALLAKADVSAGLDQFYNLSVLAPAFSADSGDGDDGWQLAAFLPSASAADLAALGYVGLRGLPFRILASSAPGDTLDLVFETEAGSGIAGVVGAAVEGGRILRIGADGSASVLAQYGITSRAVSPVPEPGTWALLLVGGALLAWRLRRAAPRCRRD